MKSTKFVKSKNGNLLIEAMLGIALAGAGFLIFYEIEHHLEDRKQFSKVTSDIYQQYNVFLTALEKYGQSNNSTQVVSCQTLKNGYLAQNFNCTDYLGDTLEGILVKNQTQTPTAYVVGVPSTSSQNLLHSYNVSSIQVLNQALAQSQPQNTPHEFFVINLNNYIGYPVTNISQSMSFSTIASYLPQQGLKLGNNSYVIALVDASTLNPSAAPPSCYSSSSMIPPSTWQHCFVNQICNTTCSGTVCVTSCTPSYTLCSYTEWQPYQYCSYVNGQTSTSNNGFPFTTSSCNVVNYCANQSSSGGPSGSGPGGGQPSCSGSSCSTSPQPSSSSGCNTSISFIGTSACPSGYIGSISNYDSVTSCSICTNGACSYWSTSSPASSVSNCNPARQPPGGGPGGNGGGPGSCQGTGVCPSGYVWNPYQCTCVNETQYAMACYYPYINAVASGPTGVVICGYTPPDPCPPGATIDPTSGVCMENFGQYTCPPGYTLNPQNKYMCISGSPIPCPDYETYKTLVKMGWNCSIDGWCAIQCSSGSLLYSVGGYGGSNGTAVNGYYYPDSTIATLSGTPVNPTSTCPGDGWHPASVFPGIDIASCVEYGIFISTTGPLACPAGEYWDNATGTCQPD